MQHLNYSAIRFRFFIILVFLAFFFIGAVKHVFAWDVIPYDYIDPFSSVKAYMWLKQPVPVGYQYYKVRNINHLIGSEPLFIRVGYELPAFQGRLESVRWAGGVPILRYQVTNGKRSRDSLGYLYPEYEEYDIVCDNPVYTLPEQPVNPAPPLFGSNTQQRTLTFHNISSSKDDIHKVSHAVYTIIPVVMAAPFALKLLKIKS